MTISKITLGDRPKGVNERITRFPPSAGTPLIFCLLGFCASSPNFFPLTWVCQLHVCQLPLSHRCLQDAVLSTTPSDLYLYAANVIHKAIACQGMPALCVFFLSPWEEKAKSFLLGVQLSFSFNLLYMNIYTPET